jgi:microcystin-dependent protein
MSEPFLGEIKMFAGNFAPQGYALCDGQLLAISQFDALFSLVGTTYGGDGRTTFGLPDLRGRVPIHMGSGPGRTPRSIGQKSGQERVTLTTPELPSHTHAMQGSSAAADDTQPAGKVLARAAKDIYIEANPDVNMAAAAIGNAGGGQSHENMQPFQCINYIIALVGIYPSRS